MKQLLFTAIACLGLFAAQAQGYHMENGEVKVEGGVYFDHGSSVIKPESATALDNVKKYLDDKSYISLLRVESHVAGDKQNQSLSEARSRAVCAWLIAKGVDCKRLIPVGFGAAKPVLAQGETDPHDGLSNTRICFVNVSIKGRPIGGMEPDGGGKVAGDPCKE